MKRLDGFAAKQRNETKFEREVQTRLVQGKGSSASMTSEGEWKRLQNSLPTATDKIFGHGKRRHVNWFTEKREVLEGPSRKHSDLHAIWLSSKRDIVKRTYATQRRLVAQMVRKVKNEWFQQKAQQIEKGIEKGVDGCTVLQGIRDIQCGKAGLRPRCPHFSSMRSKGRAVPSVRSSAEKVA